MKILSQKTNKHRIKTITLELEPGETLMALKDSALYKLGEPLNDVVQGHILIQARPAHWCSVQQAWVY